MILYKMLSDFLRKHVVRWFTSSCNIFAHSNRPVKYRDMSCAVFSCVRTQERAREGEGGNGRDGGREGVEEREREKERERLKMCSHTHTYTHKHTHTHTHTHTSRKVERVNSIVYNEYLADEDLMATVAQFTNEDLSPSDNAATMSVNFQQQVKHVFAQAASYVHTYTHMNINVRMYIYICIYIYILCI